jgi:DNA-directed RNA polymerase beta subunit
MKAGYLRMVRDKKAKIEFPAMFCAHKGEEACGGLSDKKAEKEKKVDFYPVYEFRLPRHSEQECRQRDLTYSAPLYVNSRLLVKEPGKSRKRTFSSVICL